ncbi:hypothetical protein CHARACLAT_020724 [Characodon lateralis]|uniref:Uncharacterized protein n=1 Tax=Characodon lateralis TaxID=208331 RepID=A0ABU7EBF8_9TELE|nr:hypothetical protein [Characodon lateralis]
MVLHFVLDLLGARIYWTQSATYISLVYHQHDDNTHQEWSIQFLRTVSSAKGPDSHHLRHHQLYKGNCDLQGHSVSSH